MNMSGKMAMMSLQKTRISKVACNRTASGSQPPIAERIAVYLNYCCQMQKELFETVPKEEEPEKISLMRHFYSGCPNTRSLIHR